MRSTPPGSRPAGAKASDPGPMLGEVPRPTTIHVCSACGHQEARWHGQCPGCGEWNTLVEEAPAVPARGRSGGTIRAARPQRLRDVQTPEIARLQTGIREFDRVLGGGLVPGSLVLLVGHVTKEGSLAGPRVLEHLVDCVLQFEGERERTYRTLRALKNRFGSTNEVGVFEMRSGGLVEVLDASARFVGEVTRAPGSVVLAAMEGTRPLLVEVQALVSASELVPPRRMVNGVDRNRLALVLAVLARHAGVPTGSADVFVNVVGGVRIDEPGADLAVALAVASAARGAPAGGDEGAAAPAGEARQPGLVACFGEVGLTGELRSVAHPERRLEEAAKFGLKPVLHPGTAPSLRAALRAALPRAERTPRAA